MDIAAVRADLGEVASDVGFTAWDYAPDDVQSLPAAVVGGIKSMNIVTLGGVTQAEIGILFYCSLANPEDATRRLDLVLSLGDAESYLTQVIARAGAAWSSVRFVSAGTYQRYAMPDNSVSLGCEVILEVTG